MIFRLGKLLSTKGPGLIFLIPIVDRMVRMDLRVVTIDVARQEVMTRDNVPMTVDGRRLFSRHRSSVCGRASGELPESDFAHCADNVAQRARTGGTR